MVHYTTDTRPTSVWQPSNSVTKTPDAGWLAQAKLMASPYSALRALTCESHEGVLTIRGRVPTFYLKQLAQTAVRNSPGVEVVNNLVQVDLPGERSSGRPASRRRMRPAD